MAAHMLEARIRRHDAGLWIAAERVTSRPPARLSSPPSHTLLLALRRWPWVAPRAYVNEESVALRRAPRWALIAYHYAPSAPPAPVAPLPVVPPAFRRGLAPVPSCLAVQGVLAAIHAASASAGCWAVTEGGHPAFSYRKRAGTITTYVRPPRETARPRDTLTTVQETLRELNDDDGDALLIALAHALDEGHRQPDGTTWLTADAVLDERGVAPKTHSAGGARYRAGHRRDDRARVAASMDRLDHLWVRLDGVELLEPRPGGRPRRAYHSDEGKLLVIAERVVRDGLPVAWRYAPGPWLAPFLRSPNRQTAVLSQKALRYDPYRARWEKRLARYVTFHLRMDAKNARPLVRRIGPLLDSLHLPPDRRHPERTRARFETALRTLARDGVIEAWDYTDEGHHILATLPSRGWAARWRDAAVAIQAPRAIRERYASIATRTVHAPPPNSGIREV